MATKLSQFPMIQFCEGEPMSRLIEDEAQLEAAQEYAQAHAPDATIRFVPVTQAMQAPDMAKALQAMLKEWPGSSGYHRACQEAEELLEVGP